jgi:hypothetical protein
MEDDHPTISKADDALMSVSIKPSDYSSLTSSEEIAEKQYHLPPEHKSALAAMLHKHQELFGHTLGKFPNQKVKLHLIPGAKPIHCKPFSVPNKNLAQLKQEINTLLDLDVIEPVLTSLCAFPTFLIPKKDGTARFVSDFRKLNQVIETVLLVPTILLLHPTLTIIPTMMTTTKSQFQK